MKAFRDITISIDGLKIIEEEWCKHNSIPECSLVNYWSNRMNLQIIEGARMTGRLVYGYVGDGWPGHINQDHALGRDSRNLKEAFVGDLHCRDIGDAIYQANTILDVMKTVLHKVHVMDFGSGYGRLAIPFIYFYRKKGILYVGVDAVPISLIIAPQFVEQAIDAKVVGWDEQTKNLKNFQFVSLPSWRMDEVKQEKFHVFITIHSFQEMTRETIDFYVNFAHNHAYEDAIFYSINLTPKDQYVPDSWELISDIPYPIKENRDGPFREKLWRIQ